MVTHAHFQTSRWCRGQRVLMRPDDVRSKHEHRLFEAHSSRLCLQQEKMKRWIEYSWSSFPTACRQACTGRRQPTWARAGCVASLTYLLIFIAGCEFRVVATRPPTFVYLSGSREMDTGDKAASLVRIRSEALASVRESTHMHTRVQNALTFCWLRRELFTLGSGQGREFTVSNRLLTQVVRST